MIYAIPADPSSPQKLDRQQLAALRKELGCKEGEVMCVAAGDSHWIIEPDGTYRIAIRTFLEEDDSI